MPRWFGPALSAAIVSAAAVGAVAQALPAPDKPPLSANEAEGKILSVLDDMHRNQSGGMMNVPPEDGRVLRVLVEATGARHVVEIGTSNGYSGLWICLGLRATGGKLTTYEIDAHRASLARENFQRAGVAELVTLAEGDAHVETPKLRKPIDMLFLDADKEGYIDYLTKLLPLVRPGGLILAHNAVDQAAAMHDYLQTVTSNPALETIVLQKHARGMAVTLRKRESE